MSDTLDRFSTVFATFVYRSAYTPGQLSSLSAVPKNTIVNWLNGRVQRPRSWHRIVAIAAAMRLTESEANQLLHAAQHPSLSELWEVVTDEKIVQLFALWETELTGAIGRVVPFQAVPLPPYFVGREDMFDEIEKALMRPQSSTIYCLHGMGGVGKTTLAAQLAYRLQDHFSDGVLWARVDHSDTMSILASFAEAYQYDVSHYHDIASRSRTVRTLLQSKRALLVLDNVQSSDELMPLLPPTGHCTVLVTTRRQDLSALVGAMRFEVRPFTTDASESIDIFHTICGVNRFSREDNKLLAQIAADLGHLPLALVIAASRLAYEPNWQLAEFWERLQQISQKMRLLRYDAHSVQQSFQMSYDLLPQTEKRVLAAVSWLSKQDFSQETITQLVGFDADTTADALRQLSVLSLLQVHEEGRYILHPLVHDFARTISPKPDGSAEMSTYWSRFIAENRQRFDLVARELGHIDEAISVMVNGESVHPLLNMLQNLMPCLIATGDYLRAERYLQAVQSLFTDLDDRYALCWLQWMWGHLYRHKQQLDQAKSYLETGLSEAQKGEAVRLVARFLTELGIVCNCQDDYEQGRHHLGQALLLARKEPPNETFLELLEEFGVLSLMEGNRAEAEHYYRQGLQAASDLEASMYQVLFLKGVGAIHHLRKERTQARQLFEQGLALAEQIQFRRGRMLLLNNLGVCAFFEGDSAEAGDLLKNGLQEAVQLHNAQGEALILNNLARWARHNNYIHLSQNYFRRLLKLAQTHQWDEAARRAQQELDQSLDPLPKDRPTEHLRVFI